MSLEGSGFLAANSLIILDSSTSISADIFCASDSPQVGVGSWIGPDGQDLTNDIEDPFVVTFGPSAGFLTASQIDLLGRSFTGVYSCQLPDAAGVMLSIHVGMYIQGAACKYY